MHIMTRMGTAVLEKMGTDASFVPALHSVGAPLEPGHTWAEQDIADAARWVQGPYFYAVHQENDCSLKTLCPLCKEGQQVTEWLI